MVIICPLSIINSFHLHSVLFFVVTTPCSSPHSLCVSLCAFPQLSRVCFLVLFLGRKAHRKFCTIFYNLQISTCMLLNFLKESKILVIIMGLGGDGFLCLSLPTVCQLQVKNSKCLESESILLCRCLGYVGFLLLIVLWHISCLMHFSFFALRRRVQPYCKCPPGHLTQHLICLILRSSFAEDLYVYPDGDSRTRADRVQIFSAFPSQTEAIEEPIWLV